MLHPHLLRFTQNQLILTTFWFLEFLQKGGNLGVFERFKKRPTKLVANGVGTRLWRQRKEAMFKVFSGKHVEL
jgi:hypothetical protein